MKKLIAVITACLVIITLILLRREYAEHRAAHEAEAALSASEDIKPPRFKTAVPPKVNSEDSSDRIIISIDEGGVIKLNGQDAGTVTDKDKLRSLLDQTLRERTARGADRAVFVRASVTAHYDQVVEVINVARSAGAHPVGLQPEIKK